VLNELIEFTASINLIPVHKTLLHAGAGRSWRQKWNRDRLHENVFWVPVFMQTVLTVFVCIIYLSVLTLQYRRFICMGKLKYTYKPAEVLDLETLHKCQAVSYFSLDLWNVSTGWIAGVI